MFFNLRRFRSVSPCAGWYFDGDNFLQKETRWKPNTRNDLLPKTMTPMLVLPKLRYKFLMQCCTSKSFGISEGSASRTFCRFAESAVAAAFFPYPDSMRAA